MNWSSWSDFVAMGGYGLYVWGSFAMCAVVLALELTMKFEEFLRGKPAHFQ